MKPVPGFRPSISYHELNGALFSLVTGRGDGSIAEFERAFADYFGVRHAVRVPSARWGLYYLLKCMDLKEGDEVIVPAFTYFAVPAAVIRAGLKPVFADVLPGSILIDPEEIERKITERTRAVIPTHLCGFVCDMDSILNIAQKRGLRVIEDCAQSLGARWGDSMAGSLGTAAYFTFGATKNYTTLGGGAVATSDEALARRLRAATETLAPASFPALFKEVIKTYVMKTATSRPVFPLVYAAMSIAAAAGVDIVGKIFRETETLLGGMPGSGLMNGVQAELGIGQLALLDRRNEARRAGGMKLYERLAGGPVSAPALRPEAYNIFSGCPVFVKDKYMTKKALLKKGIDTAAGFLHNCADLDIFSAFRAHCPHAAEAVRRILYLPLYAELTDGELESIIDAVRKTADGIKEPG